MPKPYRGPQELRLEASFPPTHPVKLAITSWAYGAFDVLHPLPRGQADAPGEPQAAEAAAAAEGEDCCAPPPAKRARRAPRGAGQQSLLAAPSSPESAASTQTQ